MLLNVKLDDYAENVLSVFGDIDEVIVRIVDEMTDKFDKPACPVDTSSGHKHTVNIVNEEFVEAVNTYGKTSPYCSLRRLVYYFLENGCYEELGWKPVRAFTDTRQERNKKKFEQQLGALHNCALCLDDEKLLEKLKDIEDYYYAKYNRQIKE